LAKRQPREAPTGAAAAGLDLERLLGILTERRPTKRLWIAYSGGLDSHVLLHACARLRSRLPCDLAAVHLDHDLQPASADWARHCRRVCEELGIPLTTRQLSIKQSHGESLEAVARQARLAAFADLLQRGDLLATGHHGDDQAETVLLALLRGSGPRGLGGMAAERPIGPGRLVRPLLGWTRSDLRIYAEAEGLKWVEDPSNADTDIDRNLLRHQILPALRGRWPAADATIARSARHCADAAALLHEWADAELPAIAGSRPGTLAIDGLLRHEERRQRVLLRRAIERQGFRAPTERLLGRILSELAKARQDASPLVVWPGCEARRYRGDIYLIEPLPPVPTVTLRWRPGQVLLLPPGLGRIESAGQLPSSSCELGVQFAPSGLHCRGADGRRRAAKKVWQQAGIPDWLRSYVPIFFDDAGPVLITGVAACSTAAPSVRWHGHPWEGYGLFNGP
jgi:tRNA(Ile)-lysidine synthase